MLVLQIGDKFDYPDGDVFGLEIVAIGDDQVVGKDSEGMLWTAPFEDILANTATFQLDKPTI